MGSTFGATSVVSTIGPEEMPTTMPHLITTEGDENTTTERTTTVADTTTVPERTTTVADTTTVPEQTTTLFNKTEIELIYEMEKYLMALKANISNNIIGIASNEAQIAMNTANITAGGDLVDMEVVDELEDKLNAL